MLPLFNTLLLDESGRDLAEYAILIGLIAIAVIVAVRLLGTELRDQPMRSLCDLGGWRDPNTVVKCYQSSDEGHLREVLANRKTLAN